MKQSTHTQRGAISAVPTNVITGFLGVGKTSSIIHLLKTKPAHERWAVLVNEFGEVGVDGSLFTGQHTEASGIYIKEVPGGCMCCVAGLPMQIALNQLLARAKPDRLLIEPTGLGHPLEVMQVLASDVYKPVLSIQKTVTLVDARKLDDPRYTEHQTFNQQIAMADVVIGNKQDVYPPNATQNLIRYVAQHNANTAQVAFASFGNIDVSLLEGRSAFKASSQPHHPQDQKHGHVLGEQPIEPIIEPIIEPQIPDNGYLKASNRGEGYQSLGWRFSADKVFDRAKLHDFMQRLSGHKVERAKAVFITQEGVVGFNLTSDGFSEFALDDCLESRVEVIYNELDMPIEESLMACLLS